MDEVNNVEKFLNISQTARRLGVHPRTVRRRILSGVLPSKAQMWRNGIYRYVVPESALPAGAGPEKEQFKPVTVRPDAIRRAYERLKEIGADPTTVEMKGFTLVSGAVPKMSIQYTKLVEELIDLTIK